MTSKKPQLRRCGLCNSVGHNKATCSHKIAPAGLPRAPRDVGNTSNPGMVKFFVHHVNTPAETSPHVVNLKPKKSDLWDAVNSAAPAVAPISLFHSYHVHEPESEFRKNASQTDREPFFSDLTSAFKRKNKNRFLNINLAGKNLTTIRNFATVIILIIGLVSFAPGAVRGYYEDVASTKTTITDSSTAGFLALQESTAALKSADLTSAEAANTTALNKFNVALGNLASRHTILQTLAGMVPFVHGELESREKILLAGEEIAIGNSYLISTLQTITGTPSTTLTYKLDQLVLALNAANPNYERALQNLNAVNLNSLPFVYQEQFKDFRSLFQNLIKNFRSITNLNDTLQEIFGGKGQRRYLVIFQNPAELRPTGGFMGSFAILDVKDGNIVHFTIPPGGTYDLDGQLTVSQIPPLPLTIVNKRWEFQDANWFPDFSASAQKILWFYNRSWNETADGVIAVNASVLERLLGVIGPITDSTRSLNLQAGNAIAVIQNEVENGPDKLQNKPKQILADLTPTLLDVIKKSPTNVLLPLLGNLEEALRQKEIQAYFTDQAAESTISSSGWGGTIVKTDPNSDYLLVINTNLQGQKSDARIKQLISHEAVIQNDGSVIDTVVITREHSGLNDEKFYGAPNIDYLRVYVPDGSTLLSASGFTWPEEKNFRAPDPSSTADQFLKNQERELGIDQTSGTRVTSEFNKTAFGNWVITEPGSTSQVVFSYRLPFKIEPKTSGRNSIIEQMVNDFKTKIMPYRLTVQKQSGITSDFESQVVFPPSWQPSWLKGTRAIPANNGFKVELLQLTEDEIWSVLLKKNQ